MKWWHWLLIVAGVIGAILAAVLFFVAAFHGFTPPTQMK